ncbi:hypothetical protein AB0L75_01875 [Streptomyces sp. NPDC052101]
MAQREVCAPTAVAFGAGTSAGALATALLNPFFHHLGTRRRHPAPALKSS